MKLPYKLRPIPPVGLQQLQQDAVRVPAVGFALPRKPHHRFPVPQLRKRHSGVVYQIGILAVQQTPDVLDPISGQKIRQPPRRIALFVAVSLFQPFGIKGDGIQPLVQAAQRLLLFRREIGAAAQKLHELFGGLVPFDRIIPDILEQGFQFRFPGSLGGRVEEGLHHGVNAGVQLPFLSIRLLVFLGEDIQPQILRAQQHEKTEYQGRRPNFIGKFGQFWPPPFRAVWCVGRVSPRSVPQSSGAG